MYPELETYIRRAALPIDTIPQERIDLLSALAAFVSSKREAGEVADLTFICTHNSRRSQMAQVWAAVAASHCGIDGVRTYSGGTEATSFNPRAVAAMERAGFAIESPGGDNPRYRVRFCENGPVLGCFSKRYDDPSNPASGFAAIMTCSDADEACPIVHGAALRLPIRYEDPKIADGTPRESAAYDERCRQIASEMLFVFSRAG